MALIYKQNYYKCGVCSRSVGLKCWCVSVVVANKFALMAQDKLLNLLIMQQTIDHTLWHLSPDIYLYCVVYILS